MSSFWSNLAWSYGALLAMGASGLLISLIVGAEFGPAGLGAFNQALAVYIVVSQLSVMGIHWACFRLTAEHATDEATVGAISTAGLALGLLCGAAFAALLWVMSGPIGSALGSPEAARALQYMAPSLVLLNINRVLLAVLNGLQRMRQHSEAQMLRYAVLLGVAGAAAVWGNSAADVAWCFLVSEAALLAFFCVMPLRVRSMQWSVDGRKWLRPMLTFGAKGTFSGVAAELNVRADLLVIGLFLSDAAVGVYALASVVFEGVLNLLYAVRLNINPTLVRSLNAGDQQALHTMLRQARWLHPALAIVWVAALLLYEPVVGVLLGDPAFAAGYVPLLVLLGSLVLAAGLVPFDQVLLQGGHAGLYSLTQVASLGINVLLNIALVPPLGLLGAAVGTATALLCGLGLSLFWADRLYGLRR